MVDEWQLASESAGSFASVGTLTPMRFHLEAKAQQYQPSTVLAKVQHPQKEQAGVRAAPLRSAVPPGQAGQAALEPAAPGFLPDQQSANTSAACSTVQAHDITAGEGQPAQHAGPQGCVIEVPDDFCPDAHASSSAIQPSYSDESCAQAEAHVRKSGVGLHAVCAPQLSREAQQQGEGAACAVHHALASIAAGRRAPVKPSPLSPSLCLSLSPSLSPSLPAGHQRRE